MKTFILCTFTFILLGCTGKFKGDNYAMIFKYPVKDKVKLERKINEMKDLSDEMKKFIYYFRLMTVDSSIYIDEFVKYFPEDKKNLNIIYNIELQEGLTPYFLFSFESLGRYAVENKNDSIRKLFNVYCHSDGVIAELLSDYIIRTLQENTSISIFALNQLDPKDRWKIRSCLEMLPENDAENILKQFEKQNVK
ncbi:hypothetical protein JW948_02700 [bacterium]|nr:hypothetical protein [bacterium]